MKFNHSKLRGKIREVFGTEQKFANALGVSHTTISMKLLGRNKFTQDEIEKARSLLNIQPESIHDYFFCSDTLE